MTIALFQRRLQRQLSRVGIAAGGRAGCLTRLSDAAYFLGGSQRLTSSYVAGRQPSPSEEQFMFIILWVVIGVLLGGCAGLLLIAGLQLSRGEGATDSGWNALDHSGSSNPHGGR
jgi:hypothetical protein